MTTGQTKVEKTTLTFDGKTRTVKMPSLSRPGVTHTVLIACSCEGFQFNGYCYHLSEAAVIAREDARAAAQRTKSRLLR